MTPSTIGIRILLLAAVQVLDVVIAQNAAPSASQPAPASTPQNAAEKGYTPWSPWSKCSVSCAGGSQTRFRDCLDNVICGGGRETQHRNCNTVRCPIHGGWEPWESWVSCTKTCGGGVSSRERSCDAPSPSFGGRFCVGGVAANIDRESVEWQWKDCNTHPCAVNGAWSEWTAWTNCTVTCGGGTSTRERNCSNPAPAHGGLECDGVTSQTRQCNQFVKCPIDGVWSLWSEWSYCSSSCRGGTSTQERTCTNPFPIYGGKDCIGIKQKSKPCNSQVACPVDGAWTEWGLWSTCSSTCKGGKLERTRTCTNPPPSHGGWICLKGEAKESKPCNTATPCPIHGGWSQWTLWGACSSTCIGGNHTRSRTCTVPAPSLGGDNCVGQDTHTEPCNLSIGCPVNGMWAPWTAWTKCSSPCGGGAKTRGRTCTGPPPSNGGAGCVGPTADAVDCNMDVPC